MNILSLKKFFRLYKSKSVKELREEMRTARDNVDALLKSVEGIYPSFERLQTAVNEENKENALYEIKQIGRWSPSIGKKEKREIISIKDLDEDIKLSYPELHQHIMKSQNEVEIYVKDIFIKNFSRHFGDFSKLVTGVKSKGLQGWEQVNTRCFTIKSSIGGLVTALKNLRDNLDIEGARKKHYAEDMTNIHNKLISMYLRDNEDNVKELLRSYFESHNKSLLKKYGRDILMKKGWVNCTVNFQEGMLVIRLETGWDASVSFHLSPYVRFENNQEGFYVSQTGNSGKSSPRIGSITGVYEDLNLFIEKFIEQYQFQLRDHTWETMLHRGP